MIVRNQFISVLLILTIFNLVGCNQRAKLQVPNLVVTSRENQPQSQTSENKLNVTVSIAPQKYFVEKIGGKLVTVNVMVEPGVAPETYEPLPQQLVNFNQSSAYITIDVPFEETWLDKIKSANPEIIFINSGEGIARIPIVGHDHHDEKNHDDKHHHEKEKINKQETLDPHIWLSPKLAKIQAENIYQGLVKLDPKNQATYQENLTNFLTEIEELDRQIRIKFASINKREFIIHHPSWGYLAQEYNLKQIPLELEGQEVTSAELVALIKEAKSDNIKMIFAQPQFNNKTVETFAREINAELATIDPLAENWSQNLLDTVDKLAQSMK